MEAQLEAGAAAHAEAQALRAAAVQQQGAQEGLTADWEAQHAPTTMTLTLAGCEARHDELGQRYADLETAAVETHAASTRRIEDHEASQPTCIGTPATNLTRQPNSSKEHQAQAAVLQAGSSPPTNDLHVLIEP